VHVLQDATSTRLPLYKDDKQERDHVFILQGRVEWAGIESRWGRDFPHPSDRSSAPPNLLDSGYGVSSLVIKRPVRGVDHSPLSNYTSNPLCAFLSSLEGDLYLYLIRERSNLNREICAGRTVRRLDASFFALRVVFKQVG
jgi:hypothetical protein